MINKFTEPRYYYGAIKHNMHLLTLVSRQDGKTLSGAAVVQYLSLDVDCIPKWIGDRGGLEEALL